MNYEERYNQALKRAKAMIKVAEKEEEVYKSAITIFPELEESKDERIRKEIIQSIQDNMCVIHKDKCLAWLEKQGEQGIIDLKEYAKGILKGAATHLMIWIDENLADGNMCLSNMECKDLEDAMVNAKWDKIYNYIKKKVGKQGEQKSTDESKPKFKVGDWITNGEYNWKVTDIKPLDYILQSQNGDVVDDTISYVDEEFHLWTIQDAKDGDVLCSGQIILLFKKWEEDNDCNFVIAYAGIDISGKLQITNGNWLISNSTQPATKEQCDLLFQKMKEAGYEWDDEKKELKKIYQEYPLTPSECFKPSWSEEDEEMIDFMIEFIESLWWRKDLTQRKDNVLSWLKSLKPNYWKPSEEQMEALKKRTHGLHTSSETRKALESLIDDLTKL